MPLDAPSAAPSDVLTLSEIDRSQLQPVTHVGHARLRIRTSAQISRKLGGLEPDEASRAFAVCRNTNVARETA
jgi:hypothetical protein